MLDIFNLYKAVGTQFENFGPVYKVVGLFPFIILVILSKYLTGSCYGSILWFWKSDCVF